MIITDIVPVTKQKSRVTTDEQLTFVLYKGELSHYQLEKNMELQEDIWNEIRKLLIKRAKLRAMHLLTKRDYTETELEKKLMQGEYTREAVESAVAYVKSFHYLDDARYVEKYMEIYGKSKSQRQLEFELERKGITRELIRKWKENVEEPQEDEKELIRKLLTKRCKMPETADEKEIRKHYAYLARKGFSNYDIQSVFEEFFERFS